MRNGYLADLSLSHVRPEIRAALADYVRRIVEEYGDDVLAILLYGSQAQGRASETSDIDLFVVLCRDSSALRQALADLAWQVQFQHGVVISDVLRSKDQLRRMQATRFPYYQSIEKEGILLWKNRSKRMPAFV